MKAVIYNLEMLKFLFRALFKPKYRAKAKSNKSLERDTPAIKAHSKVIVFSAQSKTLQSDASGSDGVFDAATAHPVDPPLVLEGPAYVTDGDTITIQKTQVRLYGIDAPELHHPFGKNAKWAMVRLCKGQRIRAEITDEDKYGRTVAKCFLPDGRDLSEELVKQGLALDWPKFSGGKYSQFEVAGVRKKLWLADARQKGNLHVWEKYDAQKQVADREE